MDFKGIEGGLYQIYTSYPKADNSDSSKENIMGLNTTPLTTIKTTLLMSTAKSDQTARFSLNILSPNSEKGETSASGPSIAQTGETKTVKNYFDISAGLNKELSSGFSITLFAGYGELQMESNIKDDKSYQFINFGGGLKYTYETSLGNLSAELNLAGNTMLNLDNDLQNSNYISISPGLGYSYLF
jgi:hypothetical protein